MSRLTSSVCFCGVASPVGGRRSAILERLCLEARLRVNMGEGAQALVLYQTKPASGYSALLQLKSYTVACAVACEQACLASGDVLTALQYGFDRVFVELSSDPQAMKSQMILMEELMGSRPELQGSVGLFSSQSALRILIEHEDAGSINAPVTDEEMQVCVGEGCTLCGACSWACPTQAIQFGEGLDALQISDALCTGCGMCATACPENVVSLEPTSTRLFA